MKELDKLRSIMKSLRHPDTGCPWDREQTIDSIKGFTLEEAYEVVDAIERNDMNGLCDELGDLLFHIIFYSEMADELDQFELKDVLNRLIDKLERRHPHVFSDMDVNTAEEVKSLWEAIKQQEREETHDNNGLLGDISAHLPAIQRARKLQKRAASVGFDWTKTEDILNKIDEEMTELSDAIKQQDDMDNIKEEIGDLLFCCINLARHLKIDPELALRDTNIKFVERFNYIESSLAKRNKTLEESNLEEMDELWNESKEKLT